MIGWDYWKLQEYGRTKMPKDIRSSLHESIETVCKKELFCDYHRKEFLAAYDLLESTTLKDSRLDNIWLACSAHAFAYAQNAHAVVDVIMHVIYHAHGGQKGEVFEGVALRNVGLNDRMKAPLHGTELGGQLSELEGLEMYKYLRDLTNVIKHSHLVPIRRQRKLLPGPNAGYKMKFMHFTQKSRAYDEKEISTFFDETHEPLFSAVHKLGRELNISLKLER